MLRLIVLVVLLALGSKLIVPLAETLQPILGALAVLALAAVGLWMIARAPFDRYRGRL